MEEEVGEEQNGTLDSMTELLSTYNELNSAFVEELLEAPSALEFMRYVARNRPFVVRGGASNWEATKTWKVSVLKKVLQDQSVNVAVTLKGNADSPTENDNGEVLFVKPWEEQQRFDDFIDFLREQELSGITAASIREVRYAQTQNDNLRNEYAALFSHVEKDIPWARIALQQKPDAINLWIGNSLSISALHKDNYENIYVQIIGQKHFVLLPPVSYACVAERDLSPASYRRNDGGSLELMKEDGERVPFATWDPDQPGKNGTEYSKYAKPVRVTLEEGDMLYLPALWYHKVSQSCSEEGLCCAVNYWYLIRSDRHKGHANTERYDMDFSGGFYSLCKSLSYRSNKGLR